MAQYIQGLLEVVQLSEKRAYSQVHRIAQSLGLSDVFTNHNFLVTLGEVLSHLDSLTTAGTFNDMRAFKMSILPPGIDHVLFLLEFMGMSESRKGTFQKKVGQAVSFTDGFFYANQFLALDEGGAFSDGTIHFGVGSVRTETVPLSDYLHFPTRPIYGLSESFQPSDSILVARFIGLVEEMTPSGLTVFQPRKAASESLPIIGQASFPWILFHLGESIPVVDAKELIYILNPLLEGFSLSGVFSKLTIKTRRETVYFLEAKARKKPIKAAMESFSPVDTIDLLWALGCRLNEVIGLAGVYSQAWDALRGFSDSITLQSSMKNMATASKSESIPIVESEQVFLLKHIFEALPVSELRSMLHSRTPFLESFLITEKRTLMVKPALAETIQLLSQVFDIVSIGLSEGLPAYDTYHNVTEYVRLWDEPLSVIGDFRKTMTRVGLEAFSASETITKNISIIIRQYPFSMFDELVKGQFIWLYQGFYVTEKFWQLPVKKPKEELMLSESRVFSIFQRVKESFVLSIVLRIGDFLSFSESLGIAEAMHLTYLLSKGEGFTFSESTLREVKKAMSESFQFTGVFSKYWEITRSFYEPFLAEALFRIGYSTGFSESFGFSETFDKLPIKAMFEKFRPWAVFTERGWPAGLAHIEVTMGVKPKATATFSKRGSIEVELRTRLAEHEVE